MEFLNELSKLPAKDIETSSQSWKVEETFSPSHDMVKYENS